MYIVCELYDIKGHYGCTSTEQILCGVFATKADACAFKRKHRNPLVYKNGLWCGHYVVTEINPSITDVYNRLHRRDLCCNCDMREVCEKEII